VELEKETPPRDRTSGRVSARGGTRCMREKKKPNEGSRVGQHSRSCTKGASKHETNGKKKKSVGGMGRNDRRKKPTFCQRVDTIHWEKKKEFGKRPTMHRGEDQPIKETTDQ